MFPQYVLDLALNALRNHEHCSETPSPVHEELVKRDLVTRKRDWLPMFRTYGYRYVMKGV
jgi:hypothetical protein